MRRYLFSLILAVLMVSAYSIPAFDLTADAYAQDGLEQYAQQSSSAADTTPPVLSNPRILKNTVDELIIEADIKEDVAVTTSHSQCGVFYVIGDSKVPFIPRDHIDITNTKYTVSIGHTYCENLMIRLAVYDTSENKSNALDVYVERESYKYFYTNIGDTFSIADFSSADIAEGGWRDYSYYGDILQNNGDYTYTALKPGKTTMCFTNNKTGSISAGVVVVKCDHKSTETRNAKSATCSAAGYTGDKYCTICGELVQKGSAIGKTAHSWGSGRVILPAKYLSTGLKLYTCSKCGTARDEIIPKLNASAVTPGKAKIVSAKVSSGKLKLKWKRIAKKTKGYQICLKEKKSGKLKYINVKQSKKSKISKTIKKLKKNKVYAVRVRAYNKVNGETIYGKWSNVKSGKMK